MSAKPSKQLTNVLKDSKSPYLLQHKDNPVHWQEWNSDTIKLAKELDRPIFLSSGYSACHWCHVLAHESFENEAIAKIMNDSFVNIKLDREERPDIDRIYMTYLQATQGGGGWPLSVFLTPNLEPFFAGTYFPRERFRSLLLRIKELWDEDRQRCEELGKNTIESLRDLSGSSTTPSSLSAILEVKPDQSLWRYYVRTYDARYGGFSPQDGQSVGPKFPSCALTLEPLSRFAVHPPRADESDNREQARQMAVHMLRCMWEGGIHDWVGGGFARYSVDEKWRVPHFEKMLYDQAQLMSAAVAFAGICVPEISRSASADDLERDRKLCEGVAVDILKYVMRDLKSPEGAFYGAEDADSALVPGEKKAEGGFYLWDKAEFDEVVGEDAEIVGFVFGIQKDGNVPPRHDAHGEMTGKNILYRAHSLRETAVQFGFKGDEEGQIQEKINVALEKLRHRREETRERPGLDDKVVCAWNGMMISALAQLACLLDEGDYPEAKDALPAAEGVVRFIRENMWDEPTRTLYRSWREGRGAIAQTDDYACLVKGLIDLYEATGNEEYALFARDLQLRQNELFWDEKDKGYFASAADEHVLVRMKDGSDGAEASAASTSVHNLLRLGLLFADEDSTWETKAHETITSLAKELTRYPSSVAYTVAALMQIQDGSRSLYLTGRKDDPFVQGVRKALGGVFKPGTVLVHIDPDSLPRRLAEENVTVRELVSAGKADQPGLSVCEGKTCGLPMRALDEVRKYLLDG